MRRAALFVVPVLALAFSGRAAAQDAAKIEKGKQVYEAATPKCKVCHSIARGRQRQGRPGQRRRQARRPTRSRPGSALRRR